MCRLLQKMVASRHVPAMCNGPGVAIKPAVCRLRTSIQAQSMDLAERDHLVDIPTCADSQNSQGRSNPHANVSTALASSMLVVGLTGAWRQSTSDHPTMMFPSLLSAMTAGPAARN